MCNSGSSSSINQEYSKLTAKWPDKFWTVDNPRINHAVEITEDITKVYLAGGEPLVEPLNLALLNQLADVNPEVNLVINTSLNHLSDRFLTILNRFQHLTLAVSLDGTAAVNDYIRSGSDFATVTENIKQVMHHYLMFGSCISIYNIFNVPDLVQFVIDNYPTAKDNHGINIVGGIDELALDNVPVKLRPMLIEQLTAALDIAGAQARPGIQNLIVTLEQDNFDQARFERFKRYTTILDQNRNQSVGAVVPELAEYF
jgi:sulfatase maturation enzyme AslB (radical SAM superfamily)